MPAALDDTAGNPVSATDALGHTNHQQYNALSRLTEMFNPLGEATQFGCDSAGNTTAIVPAGRSSEVVSRFVYGDKINVPEYMVKGFAY